MATAKQVVAEALRYVADDNALLATAALAALADWLESDDAVVMALRERARRAAEFAVVEDYDADDPIAAVFHTIANGLSDPGSFDG